MIGHPIRGRIDMDVGGPLFGGLEILMREAGLFAAAGFLLLGASDLAVDLVWLGLRLTGRTAPRLLSELPAPDGPAPLAVLVPAWDEAEVIGAMLRRAAAAWAEADVAIFVGCYPNDPATIAAVGGVPDPRIRLVVGPRDGPTTKADCLNTLWRALLEAEREAGRPVRAVVLHDAEDVVHGAEPHLFAALGEEADFIQLPVLPLPDPRSRWVGGHYADEFAEAHGKEMLVRQALGAALPGAGVGCAFRRDALERVARAQGGVPFDADSLTEDYVAGLRLAEVGGTGRFVRVAAEPGGAIVATREFFPRTFAAAVRQKARWMAGIALLGWDELGWRGGVAERWMRLRDRQALLAALLLFSGYLAFGLWAMLAARSGLTGALPPPVPPALHVLVTVNCTLLGWRLLMRFGFTARTYGWREGLRAIPRAALGNAIAMAAAVRALRLYADHRRTGRAAWDKTRHSFPSASMPE
jgi:adsorption protein B